MKRRTIREAKQHLSSLADQALNGKFDALIQAGKESIHRELTPQVLKDIWKRGRAMSRK